MDRITFLVSAFFLIEDRLADRRIRQRGPVPILHDNEVLTSEVADASFGVDTDEEVIDASFRRFYPDLSPVWHASTAPSPRGKAADPSKVGEALRKHLLTRIAHDPAISSLVSCPLPACHFARSPRCRRLREYAAYDYDVSQRIY